MSLFSAIGATAQDEEGDLTDQISISGGCCPLDTSIPATLDIVYFVSDSQGLRSSTSRTVFVLVDAVVPVVTLLGGNDITINQFDPYIEPGT